MMKSLGLGRGGRCGQRTPDRDSYSRTSSLMPKHRLHREQRVLKGPDFMPHSPPHGVSPLFNSKQMKTTAETGVTMWQGLQVPFVTQLPTKVWDEESETQKS